MSSKMTKIFMSVNSHAVRIPREFQMEGNEVEIQRRGNTFVIRPKKLSWAPLIDRLKEFSSDFMPQGRRQLALQKMKRLFSEADAGYICIYLIMQPPSVLERFLSHPVGDIGISSITIAAHALSLGVRLVANNAREFLRVSELKVGNCV